MSVFVGDTAISTVYVGDTPAKAVYLGDTLVWSAAKIPDEFHWLTSDDSPTSSLDGYEVDSGQTVETLAGADPGELAASAKDSTVVFRSTRSTAACHLVTQQAMPERIIYMACKFRFLNPGGSATANAALGVIPWTTNGLTTAETGVHLAFLKTEVQVMNRVSGSMTTIAGPFEYDDMGEDWMTVEFAISPDENAVVIRTPDGATHDYTHATVGSKPGVYPDFEPFYNSFTINTDWRPEVVEMWASTLSGCDESQLAYINNLLAAEGYGPLVQPDPPPSGPISLVGTASAQTSNSVNVDLSSIDIQYGDLLVVGVFNQDGDSGADIPAGYTLHANLGGNVSNMRIVSKICTGSETSTGVFSRGDSAMAHVYRGAEEVGDVAIVTGTDRTLDFPALSLENTDDTSWVACFGGTRNENGSMANPPSGMVTRQNLEGTTHDAASYDTNGTVTSWSGGTVDIGHNTAGGHKAASVEIKVRP